MQAARNALPAECSHFRSHLALRALAVAMQAEQKLPICSAYRDAGGGTRTPDTRIMMLSDRVLPLQIWGFWLPEMR